MYHNLFKEASYQCIDLSCLHSFAFTKHATVNNYKSCTHANITIGKIPRIEITSSKGICS